MREIRFYIDPHTDQPHIYNHGVTEDEVQEILHHPIREEPNRENSRIAVGRTHGGRFLKVIYSEDDDGVGVFVITAYDIRGNALRALRRHMRRRS